jgi:PAS domain S-box-containing protein
MENRRPDLKLNRLLLLLCGGVYLLWWFAVKVFLPHSFNPLNSRLVVVLFCFLLWALSYRISAVKRNLSTCVNVAICTITLHFFYLFYGNQGDANWVMGSFITLLASTYLFFALPQLIFYSVFVLALCIWLEMNLPSLQYSVFFPGVATILLQANVSLYIRKRILDRLRDSNEKFEHLFHATPKGVLLHENGRVLEVNEALNWIFGYSGTELIGIDINSLIHPDFRQITMERMRAADTEPLEVTILRKDGTPREVEALAKNLQLRGKLIRFVTIQDLSERKRMEEERVAMRAMEERMRALDEFITLASHELKTPVTSMRLWMQLLERECEQGDASSVSRISKIAALVNGQILRLISLIETMLNVSQISTGRLAYAPFKTVDLVEIVRHSAEALQPESERVQSPLRISAPSSLKVTGDASRLMQIVDNLFTNAIKYGNQKPVDISLKQESGEAVLRVSDQGIGIEPENLERIFLRFERAASADQASGLGLGLYLAKQLAEAHGGRIVATSSPGKGSVFALYLPTNAPQSPEARSH